MSTSALKNVGGGMFIFVLVPTAVAVVAVAVLMAVGLLFAYMQVAGTAYTQAVNWLGTPTGILLIVAFATASLILPLWLVLILRRKLSWEDLGWRRPSLKWVGIAVLLVLAYGFLSGLLYAAIGDESDMRTQVQDQIGTFIDLRNPNIFSITALLLVVGPLAGMIEELLFRGFVFGWIWARAPVAVVSGVLFASVQSVLRGTVRLHRSVCVRGGVPAGRAAGVDLCPQRFHRAVDHRSRHQ